MSTLQAPFPWFGGLFMQSALAVGGVSPGSLGNALGGPSLSPSCFCEGGHGAFSKLAPVNSQVLGSRYYLKISNRIIKSVPVFVMNNLPFGDRTPMLLPHHQCTKSPNRRGGNLHICPLDASASVPCANDHISDPVTLILSKSEFVFHRSILGEN